MLRPSDINISAESIDSIFEHHCVMMYHIDVDCFGDRFSVCGKTALYLPLQTMSARRNVIRLASKCESGDILVHIEEAQVGPC